MMRFVTKIPTRQLIAIAAAGSAALLIGAYLFQFFGYAPCKMCYWQRWPHGTAIIFGLIAIYSPRWVWIAAGAISAAITSGIGFFHSGVEQKWWEGPTSCTGGGGLENLSGADLLSVDVTDKLIMCDEISWSLLGLSMPTWNFVMSALLVGVWVSALLRSKSAS